MDGKVLLTGFQKAKTTKSSMLEVIIMSDHGYRKMVPKSEHNRVPFLFKRAGQAMAEIFIYQ